MPPSPPCVPGPFLVSYKKIPILCGSPKIPEGTAWAGASAAALDCPRGSRSSPGRPHTGNFRFSRNLHPFKQRRGARQSSGCGEFVWRRKGDKTPGAIPRNGFKDKVAQPVGHWDTLNPSQVSPAR